jgi:hypothetical protein
LTCPVSAWDAVVPRIILVRHTSAVQAPLGRPVV